MAEHPTAPPADAAPPVDPARRASVARGTRIAVIVVLVLLVVGAGRTIVGRMANAKILEANVSEGAVQYVRTTVVRTSDTGVRSSCEASAVNRTMSATDDCNRPSISLKVSARRRSSSSACGTSSRRSRLRSEMSCTVRVRRSTGARSSSCRGRT